MRLTIRDVATVSIGVSLAQSERTTIPSRLKLDLPLKRTSTAGAATRYRFEADYEVLNWGTYSRDNHRLAGPASTWQATTFTSFGEPAIVFNCSSISKCCSGPPE